MHAQFPDAASNSFDDFLVLNINHPLKVELTAIFNRRIYALFYFFTYFCLQLLLLTCKYFRCLQEKHVKGYLLLYLNYLYTDQLIPLTSPIDEGVVQMGKWSYPDFYLDEKMKRQVYAPVFHNMTNGEVRSPFTKGQGPAATIDLPEDTSKGLLIVSSKGVGMTAMFHVMRLLLKETPVGFDIIRAINSPRVAPHERYGSEYLLDQYGYNLERHLVIEDMILGLLYDDTVEFMKELISEREALYRDKGFKTHFCFDYTTTWNDATAQAKDMLVNVYGEDTFKQLMGMTDVLVYQAKKFKSALPDTAPRMNTYLKERAMA